MAGRFRNEIGVTFRYAGRIRSLFLASHKNPLAQRILKSTEAISRDRGKQLMNNIYIIHPFSDARYEYN